MPAPAFTEAEPTSDSPPQVPAAAWASPHWVALESTAETPSGRVAAGVARSGRAAGRRAPSANGLPVPAAGFVRPALSDGVNGRAASLETHAEPLGPESISNVSVSSAGLFPLHGARLAEAVLVPQVAGFTSGAREPPLKSR